MRAAVIDQYGNVDRIDVREIETPRPSANEVLIRVDTAGVGTWDVGVREGEIKSEYDFPLILGFDGSGVVVEVGSRVTRFQRGDRVYAYEFDNKKGGFYAEYAVVASSPRGWTRDDRRLALWTPGFQPGSVVPGKMPGVLLPPFGELSARDLRAIEQAKTRYLRFLA